MDDEQIKAESSKLQLANIIAQLKRQQARQEESKDEVTVDLVLDRSKKDVGNLIKLNSLQKRVHFIKHVLGEWRPTPRYKTLTDQLVQVQKLLDLMDANKIMYYQKRVDILLEELDSLTGKNARMTADDRKE